jgi:hypothetical protein
LGAVHFEFSRISADWSEADQPLQFGGRFTRSQSTISPAQSEAQLNRFHSLSGAEQTLRSALDRELEERWGFEGKACSGGNLLPKGAERRRFVLEEESQYYTLSPEIRAGIALPQCVAVWNAVSKDSFVLVRGTEAGKIWRGL